MGLSQKESRHITKHKQWRSQPVSVDCRKDSLDHETVLRAGLRVLFCIVSLALRAQCDDMQQRTRLTIKLRTLLVPICQSGNLRYQAPHTSPSTKASDRNSFVQRVCPQDLIDVSLLSTRTCSLSDRFQDVF